MSEYDDLARYNSERARGLVHTAEWVERMAAEQARFDAEWEARLARGGAVRFPSGWLMVPKS